MAADGLLDLGHQVGAIVVEEPPTEQDEALDLSASSPRRRPLDRECKIHKYVNRFEYWYRNDLGVSYTWRNILTPAQRGTETFDWNSMPLSSFLSPWLGSALYLTGVQVLQGVMKNRKSISDHYPSFNYILLVHNVFLTVLSLVMFVMTSYHVVRHMQRVGIVDGWCDPSFVIPSTTEIPFWAYIFYVSKYYELLDTVFLVLKKRDPQFVQTWHHNVVLHMFYIGMETRMYAFYPLVILNSFVHVFVYGYFAAATVKVEVPWKKYITLLQISQFIGDLALAPPWFYMRTSGYIIGDWAPFYYVVFIGISFVYLFTEVYFKIEKQDKLKAAKKKE